MTDPLDDLLTLAPPALDEALRSSVFRRTTRALRWRRRRRTLTKAAVATACAACLLALVQPPPPPAPTRAVETVTESVVALEWRAIDHPDEAASLYRVAADRYLDDGDPANAVRCYANALDESASLDVSADDSWLLIALKNARKKEFDHD